MYSSEYQATLPEVGWGGVPSFNSQTEKLNFRVCFRTRMKLNNITFVVLSRGGSRKNLTVADFVCPPPGKFLKYSAILKQYLMHFERTCLSKKDKISVILRYFKMRLRIYTYNNRISNSNKLQRLNEARLDTLLFITCWLLRL